MTDGSLTKAALIERVAQAAGLTKKRAEVIVETVFGSIVETLHRGKKVELRGFGSFRLRRREPHRGRNPKTGDWVDVPSKQVAYFKPGKELKELINPGPGPARAAAVVRAGRCRAVVPPSAIGGFVGRRPANASPPVHIPLDEPGCSENSGMLPRRSPCLVVGLAEGINDEGCHRTTEHKTR